MGLVTPHDALAHINEHANKQAEDISERIRKGILAPDKKGTFGAYVSCFEVGKLVAKKFEAVGWGAKVYTVWGSDMTFVSLWRKR